jgi:Tol biopolymer transport system component
MYINEPKTSRSPGLIFVIIAAVVLLLAAGAYYVINRPGVVSTFPADSLSNIPASASILIEFSTSMNHESVEKRFSIEPANPGQFSWQENTFQFTPQQPLLPGTDYHFSLQSGARSDSLIPIAMTQPLEVKFTTGQPRLLFLSPSGEQANLFLYDFSNNETIQITNSLSGINGYQAAPDTGMVYFSQPEGSGSSNIYRVDLNQIVDASSEIKYHTVLSCPDASCTNPRLSPSGERMAYERLSFDPAGGHSQPQVWIVDLSQDSSGDFDLRPAGHPDHQTITPNWSPEGLLSIYDKDEQAFQVLDRSYERLLRIESETGQPGEWYVQGSSFIVPEILFVDEPPANDQTDLDVYAASHLIRYNISEGTVADLTSDDFAEDTMPAFSPDGRYLAFARKFVDSQRWSPGRQIWRLELGSNSSIPLTSQPEINHLDFAWSPDSDRLAYVRFDQTSLIEPTSIWVMDMASGVTVEIIQEGYAPQWLP